MATTVRPYETSDYKAISCLWNIVHTGDKLAASEIAHRDGSFEPPYKFGRFIAEVDGKLVGAATFEHRVGMYHPQKFYLDVHVYPDVEGRGIGRALYEQVLRAVEPFDPIALRGQVKENHERARAFVHKLGFVEDKRDWDAILHLESFDMTPFESVTRHLKAQGIVICSLAELQADPEMRRKFHALFSEVRQDAPRSEPATPIPFEVFVKHVFDAPDFSLEGNFVALHKGAYVGLTQLWKGGATDELFTGLTDVKRDYRGKRVALALKLQAIAFAKEIGAPLIHTDNDTRNVAMLAINDKLGFVRQPARISVVKELGKAQAV